MREECGVLGCYGVQDAVVKTRDGLHKLQHRGQESCGLAIFNGVGFIVLTYMGQVLKNLTDSALKDLAGSLAIGHTRYSTSGSSVIENAQPFCIPTRFGTLAIAHNGNLTNTDPLKEKLKRQGACFTGTSDTETILHLIAKSKKGNLIDAIKEALSQIEGSYSLVFLTKDSVIAARDPYGYRPLEIGKTESDGFVFASETTAFFPYQARHIGQVQPGEIVVANDKGLTRHRLAPYLEIDRLCVFEHVYLSRPDSTISGQSVELSREKAGGLLARQEVLMEDYIVVGVPDSGLCAALGFAKALGKELSLGLVRSHFDAERSFIQPTVAQREQAVRRKLSPNPAVVKNKRVILVDDSLVRGTTSRIIIKMLKEAGATEVHLRIAAPPILYICVRGVDIAKQSELIAVGRTWEEIAKIIEADSLVYLPQDKLLEACGQTETLRFCHSCLDNEQPQLVQIAS